MKCRPLLPTRLLILIVRYSPDGGCTVQAHRMLCKSSGMARVGLPEDVPTDKLPVRLGRGPVLVLCTGYGIITKSPVDDPEVVAQVKDDPERFCYTEYSSPINDTSRGPSAGHALSDPTAPAKLAFGALTDTGGDQFPKIDPETAERNPSGSSIRSENTVHPAAPKDLFSFVQVRQLQWLMEWTKPLSVCACHPVDLPENEVDRSIPDLIRQLYTERFSLNRMFSPDTFHAVLAAVIASHVKIPALIGIFGLLVANQAVQNRIRDKNTILQATLHTSEKNHREQEQQNSRQDAALAAFNQAGLSGYSRICDQIAAQVPENVLLKHLSIQPATKALSTLTPPALLENVVLVAGSAVRPDPVVSFTDRLETLAFIRELNLITLEYDNEERLFTFQIHLKL